MINAGRMLLVAQVCLLASVALSADEVPVPLKTLQGFDMQTYP